MTAGAVPAGDRDAPQTGPGPGKAARNERRTLFATMLNTLASATITVGVLAPAAGLLYGFSVPGADRAAWAVFVIAMAWLLGGAAQHSVARAILGGIEE